MAIFKDKNNRYSYRSTIARIISILFLMTFLLYLTTHLLHALGEKLSPFKRAIDYVMNTGFIKFLEKKTWIAFLLIAVLSISIVCKIIALFFKNEYKLVIDDAVENPPLFSHLDPNSRRILCWDMELPLRNRISFVNNSYNHRNRHDLHVVLALLFSACSVKLSNIVYKTTSGISLLLKALMICAAIAIFALAIVGYYAGKNLLPFGIIPDFVKTEVLMPIFIAIFSVISLFLIAKVVTDLMNVMGYTVGKTGYQIIKTCDTIDDRTGCKGTIYDMPITKYKMEFKKLENGEFNRPLHILMWDGLKQCLGRRRDDA